MQPLEDTTIYMAFTVKEWEAIVKQIDGRWLSAAEKDMLSNIHSGISLKIETERAIRAPKEF